MHTHGPTGSGLRLALLLTFVILIVEAVVGYLANSLALLSDAGHILTDAVALGLAWFGLRLANLPPDAHNTYGYQRSSILAALTNGVVLIVIAVFVAVEAAFRLQHPQHVEGLPVIIAALIAITVNLFIASRLREGQERNLNIRAAFLHVLGDIAASVGVVVSGFVIFVWHVYLVDPILSVLIAALIAYGAWQIIRDTVLILMEGTPPGVNLRKVAESMREIPGVEAVHDLHVWALSDGFRLLSAHVEVPDQSLCDAANLVTDLKLLLRRRFNIEHATIELESIDCRVPPHRPIRLER